MLTIASRGQVVKKARFQDLTPYCMARASFLPGTSVRTPLGKGVVREVRTNGGGLVDVQGRQVVLTDADVRPVPAEPVPRGRRRAAATPAARPGLPAAGRPVAIDLHGLTVDEAMTQVASALNDALLADVAEVRFVHGRSGGRLRAALHGRLREIGSVRSFRIDPRNAGVTIVSL